MPRIDTPAEHSKTSRRPKCATVVSTAQRHCARSVTSVGTASASMPSALACPTTSSSASAVRDATATRTPKDAKRKAVARPIPDEPPVMSAILPCNGCIIRSDCGLRIADCGFKEKSAIRNPQSAIVSPHLFPGRRGQFQQVLLGITVVRLPGCRHAFLGEAQRPTSLLERQHRLGRAAAITEVRRHALDEALKHVGGGGGL